MTRKNFFRFSLNERSNSPRFQALTWKSIVSVLLLRLLRHSIFMRTSLLSSSVRGTGSLDILVVMMAASQGSSGVPAIRNLVTTWRKYNITKKYQEK